MTGSPLWNLIPFRSVNVALLESAAIREVLGQSGMVVELGALILDERVVHRGEEVVWSGGAVVLLGIQPAGCDAGMPREDDLAPDRGAGR